jgi:hypothetical protein
MAISKVASQTVAYGEAEGQILASGCLSMLLKVVDPSGAGTTFVLWNNFPISELDPPLSFPYYDERNSRRLDDIPYQRTSGTGYLILVKDVDLNCQ